MIIFPFFTHAEMHSSGPQVDAVLTGATRPSIPATLNPPPMTVPEIFCGRPKKAFARLVVPVSSEFNAEMSCGFAQPMFIIAWTDGCGKMVICPERTVSDTVRVPFSVIIYVMVVPEMATT